MARALIVSIFANAKQFEAELEKAAGKTRKFGKAAGVVGVSIAGGLAYGLEKSVKAADEMQATTAKMDTAFHTAGKSVKAFSAPIDEAETKARNLGFSNIDVRDSLGGLVVATKSPLKAIKDLGVAEDVARFKHIALSDATKIVTASMAGSSRAARQLGINVSTVHSATLKASQAYAAAKAKLDAEFPSLSKMTLAQKAHYTSLKNALAAKFANIKADAQLADKQSTAGKVIATVSAKLHGQADAYSKTAAGGMAKFHAETENLEENLGAGLIPTVTKMASVLGDATGWLSKHTGVAKVLIGVAGTLAATLIAVSVATKIGKAATTLWTTAQKIFTFVTGISTTATEGQATAMGILNAVMDANPVLLIVTALAALGVAMYLAWTKSATFRRIVTGVFNAIKGAAMTVLNWVKGHWPIIVTFLSGPFAPLVALATNAFGVRSALIGALTSVENFAKGIWSGLGKAWGAAWGAAVAIVKGYVNGIIGFIDMIPIPTVSLSRGSFFGVPYPKISFGTTHLSIPQLAKGGLIKKKTLAMIGEAGPELVLPLRNAGRTAHLLNSTFGMAMHGGNSFAGSPGRVTGGGHGTFAMVAEIPININLADGRIIRETRKVALRAERRGNRDLHLDRGRHET